MRCWCFNEDQLRRALGDYIVRVGPDDVRIGEFLNSPEAREHKLLLRDRDAPVVATPTGTLDPFHDAEGRN